MALVRASLRALGLIPMAIIFVLVVVAVPHMKIILPLHWSRRNCRFITWWSYLRLRPGWSSYAADYNVNQPENTSSWLVFWLTYLGVFVPRVLLETIGMAFTSWIPKAVAIYWLGLRSIRRPGTFLGCLP
jgi:purine-cytosine permease-like protein